jgi:hypothetical protein
MANENKHSGYDDEKMAMINCDIIHEYAIKLDNMIDEDTRLEEWVKMKLSKVELMVASVKHALVGIETYDDGGEIAKKQLLHIGKYAEKLIEMLKGGSELMSWMESNLSICADYMDSIYHHLDYKLLGNRASDLGGMSRRKQDIPGFEGTLSGLGELSIRKNGGGVGEKNYNSEELLDNELNKYANSNGYQVFRNVHHASVYKNVPPYKTDYFLEKDGKEIYVGTWDYKSNKGSLSLSINGKFANGGGVGKYQLIEDKDGSYSVLNKETNMYVDRDFKSKEHAQYFIDEKNIQMKIFGRESYFANGGGVEKMERGARLNTNWVGRKEKEMWGQYDLSEMYNNNLDLIADVHDYFEKLKMDISEGYSNDIKKHLIEVLKTGNLKGQSLQENIKF